MNIINPKRCVKIIIINVHLTQNSWDFKEFSNFLFFIQKISSTFTLLKSYLFQKLVSIWSRHPHLLWKFNHGWENSWKSGVWISPFRKVKSFFDLFLFIFKTSKMVNIKDTQFSVKNLKVKRKKDNIFLTFWSRDSNPRFSVIFPPTIWIFMEGKVDEIKSRQGS